MGNEHEGCESKRKLRLGTPSETYADRSGLVPGDALRCDDPPMSRVKRRPAESKLTKKEVNDPNRVACGPRKSDRD